MALHASDDVPADVDKAVNIGLTTISIGKLMSRDEETEKELLRACTDLGFFYLDVRDHPSGRLTAQIDEVTAAALAFYNETQENKSKWEVNKDHVDGEEITMG